MGNSIIKAPNGTWIPDPEDPTRNLPPHHPAANLVSALCVIVPAMAATSALYAAMGMLVGWMWRRYPRWEMVLKAEANLFV